VSLETLASLSQIAGGFAVIASLIFVGVQIREQANATRAQTEQAIAANWMAVTQVVADNADSFAEGLVSTSETFAELGDGGRLRFLSAIFALFKHYENMYLKFEKGRLSDAEWEPWSNHIQMYFHQPGVQIWWGLRKTAFSPAFRSFLEGCERPPELSPAELHQAAHQAGAIRPGRMPRKRTPRKPLRTTKE